MPVSMQKRTESALVSLQKIVNDSKIDLGDLSAQVTVSADRSLSAAGQWPDVYQEAIERALALTLTGLDDDGQVPFIAFDHDIVGTATLDEDNYEGFVADFHRKHGNMGGTAYSPVIETLLAQGQPASKKGLFRKATPVVDERDTPPFFHLFFTDGAPAHSDRGRIEQLLVGARERPHFFQFVLIGGDEGGKQYLNRLNKELDGKGIDNVGVTLYDGLPHDDDTDFFNDTIREFFMDWLPLARQKGYTRK